MAKLTSRPKGNNRSPESQYAQKGFFKNNFGQDAQNKYAQGLVMPKKMEIYDWNSEIFRLSWSPVSLMMIRSKTKSLYRVHVFSIVSLWKKNNAQGHLTLKRIFFSGRKRNMSKILCVSSLSASLKKTRSKLKALSHISFASALRKVTRKLMDGCDRISNSFELLWLSFEDDKELQVIHPRMNYLNASCMGTVLVEIL